MRTPLSIYNLLDGGWRTILSITGIGVAILLIFMQLGFLGAVRDTAVVVYKNLDFDLAIRSPDYYYLCDGRTFPRQRLFQVAGNSAVEQVEPFHASLGQWSFPKEKVQRGIFILGAGPSGKAFIDQETGAETKKLLTDKLALVDKKSTKAFLGKKNRVGFDETRIGEQFELNANRLEIVGLFEIGSGLAADGAVLLNEDAFARAVPGYSKDEITLGLVKLKPGVSPDEAKQDIQQELAANGFSDFEIVTRAEVLNQEVTHWLSGTPVGFIFMAGVAVALVVGAIIVYIVLSSDVTRQLGEYATLKAMGYKNSQLSRIVFEQAIMLAVCGYLGALLVSLGLYKLVGTLANLPIQMTLFRLGLVLAASLIMCCGSGFVAIQKLRRADPADLF
jgi:putative ABC transport system permease protein